MSERLPKGWVRTTLGEIAQPSSERALPWEVSTTRYVGLEHIEPQTMTLTGYGHTRDIRSTSVRFSKGDVLYGKMRPYLNKVWVAEFDGLCSAEFLVFPKQEGVNSTFLGLRLNSDDFVTFANAKVSGERPRVHFDQLSRFPILLPPTVEQDKVVVVLNKAFSALRRAGAASLRAKNRLKRYRAAVLDDAATGELTRGWREGKRKKRSGIGTDHATLLERILTARRDNFAGENRYKEPLPPRDLNLYKLPHGWMWVSPDQISVSSDNAISAGPFGTIFKARDFRPTGVPIIFLRHVAEGRYLTDKPEFMDRAIWESRFRPYSVFGGELLIAKLGEPPGVCAIYPEGIGPAMVTPDVIKFSVNTEFALPRYLMLYLNSARARRFTTGVAFGTTRLRVTLPLFREMPIALPPLQEQRQIATEVEHRLQAADRLAERLNQQEARANALRQSLLTEAFSGELVKEHNSREHASVLLERILTTRAARLQSSRRPNMSHSRTSRPNTMQRQNLLAVLQKHGAPMSPEDLFRAAGFDPDRIDEFYRELASLRDKLIEQKPRPSESWPLHVRVLLRPRKGS